ncbi:hypothetical protein [Leptolyngbya subtilissima]|uniref:hypothetical protein n=1 Tax=Leptolyngbya subtilissima TaxID=1346803 RepID=UPI003D654DE4
MAIFADLNRDGMTVIMVTHDREVAEQCDRTITFRDGQIIADSHSPAPSPNSSIRDTNQLIRKTEV